jgi:hypothetical protein
MSMKNSTGKRYLYKYTLITTHRFQFRVNARGDIDSSWRQVLCFARIHTQKEKLELKKEEKKPCSVAKQQATHDDHVSSAGKQYR